MSKQQYFDMLLGFLIEAVVCTVAICAVWGLFVAGETVVDLFRSASNAVQYVRV